MQTQLDWKPHVAPRAHHALIPPRRHPPCRHSAIPQASERTFNITSTLLQPTTTYTMERPSSLLEAVDFWAETSPLKTALTFLDDAGTEVDALTYSNLLRRSNTLASHLVDNLGLVRGSTCLLVYPPCLDFTVAYLACLRAGVIAVPCFPPDPQRLKKDLYMFTAIQGSSGATVALTSRSYNYAKKVRCGVLVWFYYVPLSLIRSVPIRPYSVSLVR